MITVANTIKAYAVGDTVHCVGCTKAAHARGEYVADGRNVHDHHGVGMWVSDTHGHPVHALFSILQPTNCDTCRKDIAMTDTPPPPSTLTDIIGTLITFAGIIALATFI